MSHELRTPLNAVIGFSEVLLDRLFGELNDKQAEYLEDIRGSGRHLLELLNEILDLSKVEAGKMEVAPADVPLTGLQAFAERTFRPLATQKGLAFAVEIADGLPDSIHTDEQRLEQVLKNLLSNAFKFTDTGSVTLRVDRPAPERRFASSILSDADDVLAFSVTDTGIGIDHDKLMLIFEAFQQADGTTSRRYGGTGLGLSISREIARLLGGEIAVRSEPGQGSTFTLLLPGRYVELEPPHVDEDAPHTQL
jgi:signal transduction histidine kinase